MESDLPLKRDHDDTQSILRRIPKPDLATQVDRNASEITLSQKILVQRYGIFCFRVNKDENLTENTLKLSYKCDSVFLPTNKGFHRYVYFLFFQSDKRRNQALKQIKKNSALAFEVSSRPAELGLISQFLGQVKTIDPVNEKSVLKDSNIFLTKVIKEIITAFEEFQKSLKPCRKNLLYFLMFEFYLFFKKYFRKTKSEIFFPAILTLSDNLFVEKFFSVENHNADIVFEALYQFLSTEKDRSPQLIITVRNYQLINFSVIKLSKVIPEKLLIAILNKPRVKSLYLRYTQETSYKELIQNVINNSYQDAFDTNIRGLTLFNLDICISSFIDLSQDSIVLQGAKIISFLTELGHYIVRAKNATAMSVLEYTSRENSFTEAELKSKIKECKKPVTESGEQIEIALFGQKMNNMAPRAARWLTKPKNWDKDNFKEEFMRQYNAPFDKGGKPNTTFIMRASDDGLIHMGCGTFSYSRLK